MPNYPQSAIIRRLFNKGQPLSFGKGQIILGNDPEPNGVYFIDTGYVKIYSISDEGDEYLHIIYGHGEIFPLIWAYLGSGSESLYYEAISDCTVWRISRDWFNNFAQNNLEVSHAFSLQLAQQFQFYSDRIDNLEYKKAGPRVAYRLLYLAGRFGVKNGDITLIDAPITHDLFAHSINLARESVSREIEKLEKQKIIKMTDHHIQILDMEALTGKLSKPENIKNWNLP